MSEPAREVREITSVGSWLDWRRSDITASRVAALFDLHPYITRQQLVDIMRGNTGTGTGSVPDSPAMRRGRILEPAVAVAVEEERPEWKPLIKATTYHRCPDIRLGATPDYLVADDGLIQVKTTSPQQWERQHGQIPLWQTLQCLTELMVTDRAWGAVACMVCSPSYPIHIALVPRHAAAERRILDAVAAWWRAFDAGQIAGAAPSVELEAELDDGSFVDFSKDNLLPSLLDERVSLKATTSDAEKRLKEIDYQIKTRMGRASRGWLPGWAISFITQHRKETLLPARDIRVLRVKAAGEEDGAA